MLELDENSWPKTIVENKLYVEVNLSAKDIIGYTKEI